MNIFMRLAYTYIIFPLIFTATHLAGLLNSRIRRALKERHRIMPYLKEWLKRNPLEKQVVMIHASSMGEFEHIKPLIKRLSDYFDVHIIVTFFSPSAYEVVKEYEGIDLILYLPFDFRKNWKKIYSLLKPVLLVISKHDVWPNQAWMARKYNIPVYLVNASLSERSGRSRRPVRNLLAAVYRTLTGIFTISTDDRDRFTATFGLTNIQVMGDTKFDQVQTRKEQAIKRSVLPEKWKDDDRVLILGSIWQEDEERILHVIREVFMERHYLKVILVPHQPDPKTIDRLQSRFPAGEILLYSQMNLWRGQRILLVDTVGVLADLYKYGDIAYVGGSFRQGIHNVMEPAVYGIPVIYGPVHTNSFEAIKLKEAGGSIIVENESDFKTAIGRLLADNDYCKAMGAKAGAYADENLGATDRILKKWQPLFNSQSTLPG